MFKIHPSFRFLLSYILKYKYSYLLGFVFILLTNYILASIPIHIKEIIDFMYQGVNPSQSVFLQVILWAIFLSIAVVGVRTLSRIFFFNTARKIEYEVKNQLFEKITRLPREYFIKNLAGKIISQVNNDTLWVRLLCGFGLMQLINIFAAFSIIPYKMWQISPTITIYTVIALVVLFSGIHTGIIYSMKFYLRRIKCLQQLSNSILSSLNGLEVIRSCNVQDWSKAQFAKQNFTKILSKGMIEKAAKIFINCIKPNPQSKRTQRVSLLTWEIIFPARFFIKYSRGNRVIFSKS